MVCRWTWGAPSGSCRRTSGGPSSGGTGIACSPAAQRPPTGAMCTIPPPPGARGELGSRGEGVVLSHTKVHHGFRVERDPGGRWRTYRPDGSEILIGPTL